MWDAKYRGYGKDKIAWTSHLNRVGFRYRRLTASKQNFASIRANSLTQGLANVAMCPLGNGIGAELAEAKPTNEYIAINLRFVFEAGFQNED